jgi:RNA polymerase sigma factor (TIGR02999 family)
MPESNDPASNDATPLADGATERDGRVLLQQLYNELRKLAQARLRRLRPGQTLQPTALVHEAYMRLMKTNEPAWNGRAHFFGAAAQAMRDILVDGARRKLAQKRGGGAERVEHTVTIADDDGSLPLSAEDLLALHASLDKLQQEHPQAAELVLLRYFAGLSMAEIAEMQGVPLRTLERKWMFARTWLKRELRSE